MSKIAFSRTILSLVIAGIVFVGLASCGGGGDGGGGGNGTVVLPPGNRAPVVARMIVPATITIVLALDAGDPTRARWLTPQGLDHYFSDPDGDTLGYSVRSSDPGVVEPRVAELIDDEERVAVVGLRSGTATITVTARDPGGLTARQQFRVTVRQTTSRNRTPVIRTRFQDLTHTVSSLEDQRRTWTFNLASYFSDPDGDRLTYNATTTNVFIAAVSATGNQLNVRSGVDGAATITVTATDPGGLTASQSFRLTTTFRQPSNRAPVVRHGIRDVASMTVGQSGDVDVSDNFSDPDGDRLTYSARSSASDFVRASMSGGTLTFTAVQAFSSGTVTITVTARDPHGATAELSFQVLDVDRTELYGAIGFGLKRDQSTPCSQDYAVYMAWNHSNEVEAEFAALNGCHQQGGVNCRVQKFGSAYGAGNECGALAYGENSRGQCKLWSGLGSTRSAAETRALANCRSGGYSCSLQRGAGGARFAQCSK